jgi:hypothetical protein
MSKTVLRFVAASSDDRTRNSGLGVATSLINVSAMDVLVRGGESKTNIHTKEKEYQ